MRFINDSISGTPNSNWLVSFSDTVHYLQKSNTVDAALSAFLTSSIQTVSDKFEEYVGQGIKTQTYIGIYNGSGTSKLYTDNFPINSIISLQYRNSPTDDWQDFYTDSATANILLNYNFIELDSTNFPCGRKNIKIIYNAGYDTTPGSIKECALEAIQETYNNSKYGNNTLGLKSKSLTQAGTTYTYEDLWEKHKKVLDDFRAIHI